MRKNILAVLILIITTSIIYSNTFNNDFVIDDNLFIVEWPLIRDFNNFLHFFGPNNQPIGEEGVYSPLKTVFHAINYHFWGQNPFGYHLFALIIHLLGIFFVYQIMVLLMGGVLLPFLTALIFAVNPVQVEAITFLTASIDSLGVVFFFASFYFYLKSIKTNNYENQFYILSLWFAFLAIFTHELTIILPVIIILYETVMRKTIKDKRTNTKIIPFVIMAIGYILIKHFVLGQVNRGGYLYDSFYLTILVIIKAIPKYFINFFMPLTLSVNQVISPGIYSVDSQYFDKAAVLSQSTFDPQNLLSILFIVLLIFLAVKLYKTNPLYTFFIGWIFICLLPVMNIIPTGCYFAERYLYSASLGLSFILSVFLFNMIKQTQAIFHFKTNKALGIVLTVTIIMFYALRTYIRNLDWRNETTFYFAEVKSNPENYSMQRSLGVVLLREGFPDEALPFLQAALKLRSNDEDNHFALGEAYSRLNNVKEAIVHYQEAIKINNNFPEAYYNLAGIYAFLGKGNKSYEYYEKALELYKIQGREKEEQVVEATLDKYFKTE